MIQVTMETTHEARTYAVCRLYTIKSPATLVWVCPYNPQSDLSIDRMADEREAFLKSQNATIVWPE